MLALIRMDWTLNRRILLQLTPLFLFYALMALGGTRGVVGLGFVLATILMALAVFQNLRDSVEPFVCALPVSRAQIVLARYAVSLTGLALGLALALALGWAVGRLGLRWSQEIDLSIVRAGLGCQGFLLGAVLFLYLPFHFRFGGDRGLGVFAAAGVSCLLAILLAFGVEGTLDRTLALATRLIDDRAFLLGAGIGWLLLGAGSLALAIAGYRRRLSRAPLAPAWPVLLVLAAFAAVTGAAQFAHRAGLAEGTRAALNGLFAPHFQPGQPGAEVRVSRNGKVLMAAGYGQAAGPADGRLVPPTPLPIGSLSKQFTAALTLLLVEDGKLRLDASIGAYVPEVPPAWSQVTVAQCLGHTGGLPDFASAPAFRERQERAWSPARILTQARPGQGLNFPPGSQFSYSNTGYLLLGMALERVSGQPLGTLLQQRICGPLGLAHTRAALDLDGFHGHAEGGDDRLDQVYGAGNVVSTVADLTTWTLALHAGKVLKPASLLRMTSPGQTTDGRSTGYGFGLGLTLAQGHRVFHHSGRIQGFSSYLACDPEQKVVVAVLCSTDTPPPLPMERVMATACGRETPPPTAMALAPAELDGLPGNYEVKAGVVLKVWRDGGGLRLAQSNRPGTLILHAESRTRFFLAGSEQRLDFEKGPDGKAQAMVLDPDGTPLRAKRLD